MTRDPWTSPVPETIDRVGPDLDWEQAMAGMCAVRAGRQPGTTVFGQQWFAVKQLDPPLRAARLGHTVDWDPPAALTSTIQARWTCVHLDCGATLMVGHDRLWGDALEPCRHVQPAAEVIS